jgi:hypothetical protein
MIGNDNAYFRSFPTDFIPNGHNHPGLILVGANYGVDFKKISSPVKPGFGGFVNRDKVSS